MNTLQVIKPKPTTPTNISAAQLLAAYKNAEHTYIQLRLAEQYQEADQVIFEILMTMIERVAGGKPFPRSIAKRLLTLLIPVKKGEEG